MTVENYAIGLGIGILLWLIFRDVHAIRRGHEEASDEQARKDRRWRIIG